MSSTESNTQSIPFVLNLPEVRIEVDIEVPTDRPMRLAEVAHTVVGISSLISDSVERQAEKFGAPITCRKACAACCRQLVPISPAEAWMIAEFVESIPDPMKTKYKDRFRQIEEHLKEKGFLERLEKLQLGNHDPEEYREFTRDYFRLGIPCPFLVNESCSIYPYRPTICREYVVVTPPELCKDPFANAVKGPHLSFHLSDALARLTAALLGGPVQLIPLSLALSWAERTREEHYRGWEGPKLIEALQTLCDALIERSVESDRQKLTRESDNPKFENAG